MEIPTTIGQFDLRSEIVALAIILLAIAIILYLNRNRLQVRFREWRVERTLNRIGVEQIRDFICPDGLDGHYRIDRLALTPEAIVMVVYKPYVGTIFCAERISEWTQVVGQKSFKFENPLFELDNQLTALGLVIGKVPMKGYLLFSESAVFPKGQTESVIQPASIPASLAREPASRFNPEVKSAWRQLRELHANPGGDREVGLKT